MTLAFCRKMNLSVTCGAILVESFFSFIKFVYFFITSINFFFYFLFALPKILLFDSVFFKLLVLPFSITLVDLELDTFFAVLAELSIMLGVLLPHDFFEVVFSREFFLCFA